jgi:integrase/recombinase XerC
MRDLRYPDAVAAAEHGDWLSWLELGGKRPRTLDCYSLHTEPLLAAYPAVPFVEFTDSHLLQVLKRAARSNSAASMVAIIAAYRSWFRWGVKTRRRPDNPTDLLPEFKRVKPKRPEIFTVAEELALTGLPFPDGQLATILFETGARREEACHLRVRNFNLQTGLVTILGKGAKERIVPVTPRLAVAVDELTLIGGLTPDCYLWPSRPGGAPRDRHDRPKTLSGIHRWWAGDDDRKRPGIVRQAGVEYRSLHKTRHTFATRWRKRGMHLEDIQELLGHEDPNTTMRYTQTKPEELKARMEALLEAEAAG